MYVAVGRFLVSRQQSAKFKAGPSTACATQSNLPLLTSPLPWEAITPIQRKRSAANVCESRARACAEVGRTTRLRSRRIEISFMRPDFSNSLNA